MHDKWLYFLKCANQLEQVPSSLAAVPALEHAFEVAKPSRLSRKELELLEQRQMSLHDNRNAILKARQEGREEGREEGNRQARLAIARQLLDLLDLETISQRTGLSLAELRELGD